MAGSKEILSWIAENLLKDTYINIMSSTESFIRLISIRRLPEELPGVEYKEVVEWAISGLTNLDIQGPWVGKKVIGERR